VPVAPTAPSEPVRGGRELCVALDLANQPDLIPWRQFVLFNAAV